MRFKQFLAESAAPDLTFGVEVEVYFGNGHDDWRRIVEDAMRGMRLAWSWGSDQTCMPGIEIKTKPYPVAGEALGLLAPDLEGFRRRLEGGGLRVAENPGRCATHIHIGGLSTDQKVKVATLWAEGGVQDMQAPFVHPDRTAMMDVKPGGEWSYTKRVRSVRQYQTIPHRVHGNPAMRAAQGLLQRLKNFVSLERLQHWDKSYSLSPRAMGTLEFRTKESTLDGREIAALVRMAAAFVRSADDLYDQYRGQPLAPADVAKQMLAQGTSLRDMAYVRGRTRGRSE